MYDKNWHLIQRLGRRLVTDNRLGIDRIVSHDYMGSAEFEFGAVPAAWRNLRVYAINDDLVPQKILCPNGRPLYMLKHRSCSDTYIQERIQALLGGSLRLKESSYIKDAFENGHRTVAWINVPWDTLANQGWTHTTTFFSVDLPLFTKMAYELLTGDKTREVLMRARSGDTFSHLVKPGAAVKQGSFHSIIRQLWAQKK